MREEIDMKKTPKDESSREQNEIGRICAKNERRQTVKKSMESRRGWQKKKRKTKAAMEKLSNEILKGQVRTAKSGRA